MCAFARLRNARLCLILMCLLPMPAFARLRGASLFMFDLDVCDLDVCICSILMCTILMCAILCSILMCVILRFAIWMTCMQSDDPERNCESHLDDIKNGSCSQHYPRCNCSPLQMRCLPQGGLNHPTRRAGLDCEKGYHPGKGRRLASGSCSREHRRATHR